MKFSVLILNWIVSLFKSHAVLSLSIKCHFFHTLLKQVPHTFPIDCDNRLFSAFCPSSFPCPRYDSELKKCSWLNKHLWACWKLCLVLSTLHQFDLRIRVTLGQTANKKVVRRAMGIERGKEWLLILFKNQ